MSVASEYGRQLYHFSSDFLQKVTTPQPMRPILSLISVWVVVILLVTTVRYWIPAEYFWWAYVPFVFLIAGRFGALLQLIHEGSHANLSPSKKWNDFMGAWLCGFPIGVNYQGYVRGHLRHHGYTNMDKDPKSDTEKYRIADFRDPGLYLLLLKDLLGITAIRIFFEYDEYEQDSKRVKGDAEGKKEGLQSLFCMAIAGVVVLGAIFQFNLVDYLLLWLIPAISPHMFLMRIRGIAEHGLAKQLGVNDFPTVGVGTYYTRSFMTEQNRYKFLPLIWLERALIGSLRVYYHHEHHLLPNVPYYHLAEVHKLVAPKVAALNPDTYAKGYFAAALKNVLEPVRVRAIQSAEVRS